MTEPFDHHRRCQHKMYRLTCEEFDDLYSYVAGKCQICRIPEAETPRGLLCIDHAPEYGLTAVRGLLCEKCNRLMSIADERRRYVAEAYSYWRDPWFLRELKELRRKTAFRRMTA